MLLTYALLHCFAIAAAKLTLFDERLAPPTGWAPSEEFRDLRSQLELSVHLKPLGFDRLEQAILAGATPGHKQYGKHLDRDEVATFMRPSSDARNAMLKWLIDAGITDVRVADDRIDFSASVPKIDALLDANFQSFTNGQGRTIIRTLSYSVPADLEEHIEMIQPTTRFPKSGLPLPSPLEKRDLIQRQDVNFSDCNQFVTPLCLKELYKISDAHISPKTKNTLAVNSFVHDYAQYDDLAQFQRDFAPWTKGRNFTWTSVNGGLMNQTGAGSEEANLDVQYAMAIGYPAQIHIYSTGGNGPTIPDLNIPADSNEPWLKLLDYVVKLPDDKLPQTMSTSYAEDEQALPRGYATSVCQKFAVLAARGVSVVVGSGDWGPGQGCQSNDGKNTTRFIPIFPSTCPWVTSVGGTVYGSKGFPHEVAATFSSGGFSNYFKQPAWQRNAVSTYVKGLKGEWNGLYNKSGRAFPDVAAQSENFIVIGDGNVDADMGTSASAPVFAGVVALLNGRRLTAGLPPMGFLNPWIYAKAKGAFQDITLGKSAGCTTFLPPYIPNAGWRAAKGWDAVTGWGTPNFAKLVDLAMKC